MRGSITEWGGAGSAKWRLRVFAPQDPAGKGKWVSRNFAGSKREAQAASTNRSGTTGINQWHEIRQAAELRAVLNRFPDAPEGNR